MKFAVRNVKNGCRLGHLSEFANHGEVAIQTPICLMYTRGGSVPNLTLDMVEKIERPPLMAQLPLPVLMEHAPTVEKYGKGIGKFTGLQKYILYTCLHDPTSEVPSGYNDKHGISLWGRGGKIKVSVDKYMDAMEAFVPDFYQVVCDSDADRNSGKKKLKKAQDRSLNFLDLCLEKHKKSEKLKSTGIFGTVFGGYSEEMRIMSAKEVSGREVDGFVIEGFHNFGPLTESFDYKDIKGLIKSTVNALPVEKPRIMHGIWRPDAVLEVIESGIDIFDSSYPYVATDRGAALTFDFNYKSKKEFGGCGDKKDNQRPFEIDLNDSKYFDALEPILEDCSCYTCRNHTKSYIRHLLATHEMLAGVLLVIHNYQHYFNFFETIRKSLENEEFDQLKSYIAQQAR